MEEVGLKAISITYFSLFVIEELEQRRLDGHRHRPAFGVVGVDHVRNKEIEGLNDFNARFPE
jgi:hypothetical protein